MNLPSTPMRARRALTPLVSLCQHGLGRARWWRDRRGCRRLRSSRLLFDLVLQILQLPLELADLLLELLISLRDAGIDRQEHHTRQCAAKETVLQCHRWPLFPEHRQMKRMPLLGRSAAIPLCYPPTGLTAVK